MGRRGGSAFFWDILESLSGLAVFFIGIYIYIPIKNIYIFIYIYFIYIYIYIYIIYIYLYIYIYILYIYLYIYIFLYIYIYIYIFFLRPHLRHMEIPSLEVKLDLQLLAYTTAIGMQDLSCICDPCYKLNARSLTL